MIAILVSTYNRPYALGRSLHTIAALDAPVLVVDDGSKDCEPLLWIGPKRPEVISLPQNRGLAAVLNIGLSYWLADKSVEWISYFQDDVDVHPKTLEILGRLHRYSQILTGHDAGEHQSHDQGMIAGIPVTWKWAIRATHIHAHRSWWESVYPIPTRELGAPKRTEPGVRGLGSNVDWWMVRDAPRSCQNTKHPILCVPGLVRSFVWKGEDSCWNNTQKTGEEPPLGVFA